MYWMSTLVIHLVQYIIKHQAPKKIWLPIYLALHILILSIPPTLVIKLWMPPASASIVSCEMVRICMKMHSYFREKLMNAQPNEWALYIPPHMLKQGVTVEDLNLP